MPPCPRAPGGLVGITPRAGGMQRSGSAWTGEAAARPVGDAPMTPGVGEHGDTALDLSLTAQAEDEETEEGKDGARRGLTRGGRGRGGRRGQGRVRGRPPPAGWSGGQVRCEGRRAAVCLSVWERL